MLSYLLDVPLEEVEVYHVLFNLEYGQVDKHSCDCFSVIFIITWCQHGHGIKNCLTDSLLIARVLRSDLVEYGASRFVELRGTWVR